MFGVSRIRILRADLHRQVLYDPNALLDLEDTLDGGAVRPTIDGRLSGLAPP